MEIIMTRGRQGNCRWRGGWRLLKKRIRGAWLLSGDDKVFNEALGRIIRITGFIVLASLLIIFSWHELEVVWRIIF
jgi:hypothetical protein